MAQNVKNVFSVIDADTKLKWNCRVVRKGERYGKGDCLVHDKEDALIEFFDARYPVTDSGQFVSRYYVTTLLNRPANGLLLDTGSPDWRLSAATVEAVKDWVNYFLTQDASEEEEPEEGLRPISYSAGVKSISDDDLCSGCRHCFYQPGDMSGCALFWPGQEDEDGYVRQCLYLELK